MRPREVLYTDTGALRAPWRIVLFFAIALALSLALTTVIAVIVHATGLQPPRDDDTWDDCLVLFAATAICLRWIDKRPWSYCWMGRDAAAPAKLVQGFLIGALAIGVPVLVLIGTHWLRQAPGSGGSLIGASLRLTVFLLPAALLEEVMTRGYVFAVLRDAWGWKATVIVTSVAFGLLHLANQGATVGSIVLVSLAGVFLGAVLVATQSVYAAWMAHFAWNWVMAVLFHTAVSGYPMESPGYRYVDAGPDWATGGVWGPEGGVPAGLGMVAGAAAMYLSARRRRSRAAAPTS